VIQETETLCRSEQCIAVAPCFVKQYTVVVSPNPFPSILTLALCRLISSGCSGSVQLSRSTRSSRAVFGWGGQRHKATNRQAEQASPRNPTKKSPLIKFNLGLARPLFDDLVVSAPHGRGEHALPIRRRPIFSAEDGVLSAWSLEIFYGVFTRRDSSFPGGPAIEIRVPALTHGRRLLGSKRVSDFMHALPVVWRIHISNRQFPITTLAALDDIGDLCKRNLRGPQVVLVRVRAAGHKTLEDHPSTFPPGGDLR
jgi:hypothetical protein